jgi:(p)ppGpp synthase/HD superfamily hydrolase
VWEDIPNGEEYLKSNYNENIVNLVKALTEKDKTRDTVEQQRASWKERKMEEIEKVSQFSPKVLALKL